VKHDAIPTETKYLATAANDMPLMCIDVLPAIPFQEWLTRDVLPAIRKDGYYSAHDGAEPALTTPTVPAPKEDLEANFATMVRCRLTENRKKIESLRAEIAEVEAAVAKDTQLLNLLAA